jgi:hypothetical protein
MNAGRAWLIVGVGRLKRFSSETDAGSREEWSVEIKK